MAVRAGADGHAFGTLAKLLVMLATTEHVRTGGTRLDLGSASAIAKRLGLTKSGPSLEGIRRSLARLAASDFTYLPPSPHAEKLFWMIDCIRAEHGQRTGGHSIPDDQEVRRFRLFDDVADQYRDTDRLIIDVSPQFVEICKSTIAVPASIMAAVGKSPIQLDFACYLIYRLRAKRVGWIFDPALVSSGGELHKSIPLSLIAQQLGSVTTTTREFSESAKECLRRIAPVWPGLHCEIQNGRFGRSGLLQGARLILRRSPLPSSPLKRTDVDDEPWYAVDGNIDDPDDDNAGPEDRWADQRWDTIDRDDPEDDHGYIFPPVEPDEDA